MPLQFRSRLLKSFGARLKKLRKSKGLTRDQFEMRSKIDGRNLYKYENGDREPGLAIIMIMANALEIDHLELLDFAFDLDALQQTEKDA